MIKDVFILKKNAWYIKMIGYMWDLQYRDFSHMCPLFWLCVFSVLVSPLYFPIRLFIKSMIYISGSIGNQVNSYQVGKHNKKSKLEAVKKQEFTKQTLEEIQDWDKFVESNVLAGVVVVDPRVPPAPKLYFVLSVAFPLKYVTLLKPPPGSLISAIESNFDSS